MADRDNNESVDRASQPMNSFQSIWMSRWTHQEQNQMPNPPGNQEDGSKQCHFLSGKEVAADISESPQGLREVRAIKFEILNEGPAMSSRNLRHNIQGSLDSPIVYLPQKSETSCIPKIAEETNSLQVLNHRITKNFDFVTTALYTSGSQATKTSSKESHIQHQSDSLNPKELVKSHMIFGSSFAFSKSLQDAAARVLPQGFDHGEGKFKSREIAAPSFICDRQEEVNHLASLLSSKNHLSDINLTGEEKFEYLRHTEILVGKKNMETCSTSAKSVIPDTRKESDSLLLVNDPSIGNNHSSACCEEGYQRVQNHCDLSLFPSWGSSPEMTKLEMLHNRCCMPTKPNCGYDASTMRICTSFEDFEQSHPRVSETTRSLLITNKTDNNLCKENHMSRDSRVLAQLHGDPFSEQQRFSSFSQLNGHGHQGLKLELLCSSSDNERKDRVEDVNALEVVLKNESSAKTGAVDIDKYRLNQFSGVNSSPSNKDPDLPPYNAIASARSEEEAHHRRNIPELPDMNVELPAMPDAADLTENAEASTSRTESLDMDLLLSTEQPSTTKSNQSSDYHLGPESSSRWIKRLKISDSCNISLGTKSLDLGEPSHEKVNKFFTKISKSEMISSKPTSPKCAGKELMVLDQKTASAKNDNSNSAENVDIVDDIMLSNAWIQRWLRNPPATPKKKPEAVVVCEPQSSKVSLEDFQKKQFPSIAAMALMGKAMNGFQPCQFQKKGSFIVWNNKGL